MKEWVKIARKPGETVNGRTVPVGAIYGRRGESYFICDDYSRLESGASIVMYKKSWNSNHIRVSRESWQYNAIMDAIRAEGRIPKVRDVKPMGRIAGKPYARKVVYDYTPTGFSVGCLVRQSHDNADHGGSSSIGNDCSYWAIGKDIIRTGTDFELGGMFDKEVVKMRAR